MYGRSQRACRWDAPQADDRIQRKDSFSNSRVSSTSFTNRTAAVAQTPPFHSAKRRRLYGLNSRFDRMLQEASWASDDSKSFLPRHKRAYSPSSSSMTNHDLPKTPTDAPNDMGCGSGKLGKCIVTENPLSVTMSWRNACLSPSQVVRTGNQAIVKSPPELPEWLNDTLAALPTDNAVRCLTLPPERPEPAIRKDHNDWSPDARDEGSVFAFQAPMDEHHPVDPTETERLPGSDLVPFRIVRDGFVEFQGSNPAAPLTMTVPFSTPGPGWTSPQATASCCPRRPLSVLSMYRSASIGTQKVRDSPPPFSTPGPLIPVRSTVTNGHVLDCGLASQLSVAYDKVLPVAGRTGVTSLLSSHASTINSLDVPLSSVHCDGEQFLGSFSSSPIFAFGDVGGPLSDFETVPSAVYFDPPTESPLFSPMPVNTPAVPADRLVVANSSGDLSRGSPAAVMQWENTRDTTTRGSFPNFKRPPAISDSILQRQFSVTPSPPLPSRCLPTDFGWVSSNIHIPDVLESIESIDGTNIG